MDSLKSSFLPPLEFNTCRKRHRPKTLCKPSPQPSSSAVIVCCLRPDPWTLSSGNGKANLRGPKPKSKNPKNPLSDENARRIIKAKARYLSVLRRNQGSSAQTPNWIRRTPEQMVQYLEDDRNGHLYGRHVVAAIKRVRSTSGLREGEYDMRVVMSSFVTKLTFREMCVVLKEQKSWRQVRDFFNWMKLQLCYRPSVIAYTVVLRAYGQVGKIKLAEETFLEMLEAGCEPDEVACGTMLCSYAKWGRDTDMLSFFAAIQERDIILPVTVFNFMMSSLQKKSLHRDVIYVWSKMTEKGVSPNPFTYVVIINSLVKEGTVDEALKAFDAMKTFGFTPEESTYGLLISLCSKLGKNDLALHLYEDMRSHGLIPSNFTCASLLALYYRNANYSKACSLFTEMEKYGIVTDEIIFGLMIRIYGKLGLYEDAERTFDEVKKSGQLRDGKTYAAMAQVHLNFGNSVKALDIMEQMGSNNISYSRFSYIVLLKCYIEKGDLASAEVTYEALSKTGRPDITSCKQMIKLLLRLRLSEKAKSFIAQIRKDQVEFDEGLFTACMRFYCREGMVREAKQLLDELNNGIPIARAFCMALIGEFTTSSEFYSCFEALDQSEALAVELIMNLCLVARNDSEMDYKVKLLLETKIGKSVASQLICKFSKEGDLPTTEYLFELMSHGSWVEDAAGASFISLCAKQGNLKKAKEVFDSLISDASDERILYSSMIDAYVACGELDEAYLFYKERSEQGHDLGSVSVSILVKALTSTGKYHEVEDVIHGSFDKNLELDTVAYNTYINAMLEAGKLHLAVRIYERMISLNISPSIQTYTTMISVYGRGRNLDKAVEIFNTAQSMGLTLDEKIYTNMIAYFGKAGKVPEASALFKKMQEEGIKPGKVSYDIMMNIYAGVGLYREADELLQTMKLHKCFPDSRTYLAMVQAYVKGFKYAEAEGVINSMHKEGFTPSCAHFNLVLLGLAKEGSMDEADRIYTKISSTGGRLTPDLACKQAMLRGFLDFGHVGRGIEFFERECSFDDDSVIRDRFILSVAVHLYRSTGRELQAEDVLKSMEAMGVWFLDSLRVGSRAETT